jgi:PhzF family phenazine biosynthesis protein
VRIFVVDAFTDRPLAGNPAGVCPLDGPADAGWMQSIATELRHSETAFFHPVDDSAADYALRWFTPAVEVDLCGHATLGAAHVAYEQELVSPGTPIRFATNSGILTARRRRGRQISMDFPAEAAEGATPPAGLVAALGEKPTWVGRNRFDLLCEVAGESAVRKLAPDLAALSRLDARGVIVTAAADETAPYDFVSRCFYPSLGIPEDPVTGSAHCALGPYWSQRLGRVSLVGFQASQRGGHVQVSTGEDRVELTGDAVTVLECIWRAGFR